ncbi:MAG: DNA repair protein RecN [Candidatus Nitrohelix vancouverensis]|uniref:DNA repair protein RecN n=1 Tax=Candidatus Nitrohelix vancouverensis TaxID=2705534 RepID=A0A7T0C0K7_9BACT|nr:MAG: DNA repair protein RecN [Candidatus Nitrohelix vancouverensis]
MLSHLQIENFAIIDKLTVDFQSGLNVLTGETGAGKSILLDALNLILGGRADYDCIRTGETSARVEACFQVDGKRLLGMLDELGVELDDGQLIVKRVLSSNGKGRCFVNDSQVSVAALSNLGSRLVDIHGQHDHQTLLHPENHLDLLDLYGKTMTDRIQLGEAFAAWRKDVDALRRLREAEASKKEREELLSFQLNEIEQANLQEGEEDDLLAERNKLRNSEKLHQSASRAQDILSEADPAVLSQLGQALRELESLAGIDEEAKPLSERAQTALFEIEELTEELRDYARSILSDPSRLEEIEDRLAELTGLKRKYGGDLSAVMERRDAIASELESLASSQESMQSLENSIKDHQKKLQQMATELADRREKIAEQLKDKIEKELRDLNMNSVQFGTRFSYDADADSFVKFRGKATKLGSLGLGTMEFLFSPNPGEELRPLAKIASGGEISRVMLAIKTILNKQDDVPVLIFDEVDTGIGGNTAEKVGVKLKKLAATKQVFCVSHLPQIAGMADAHFSVRKEVKGKRTRSVIELLKYEERVEEIARMSAGATITDAAREHARQMILT